MDFEQLRTFIVLARNKSFSKTAEALHLVQSTVSSRIQALEAEIGKPLFMRDRRKVELTAAGYTFLPYAERLLLLNEESRHKIQSMKTFEDQLSIGATDTLWKYVLCPVVQSFFDQYPAIALKTKTGHSWDVVHHLMDGVIQLGFVYLPQSIPGFEVIPFYEEEIILVSHPDHRAARDGVVSPDFLAQLPLLYVDWGHPFYEWVRELLPPEHVPQLHIDNISMLLNLLRKNIGMGFIVRSAVEEELRAGRLAEIKLADGLIPPQRTAFLMVQKENLQRPAIQYWLHTMRELGLFPAKEKAPL
ncbi:LysR family transcriptional regulator [Aneurinibacillus sp. BA2021]|nr:LysR family transcriptional regulator [Aneurinibacillus sp. BA2021]